MPASRAGCCSRIASVLTPSASGSPVPSDPATDPFALAAATLPRASDPSISLGFLTVISKGPSIFRGCTLPPRRSRDSGFGVTLASRADGPGDGAGGESRPQGPLLTRALGAAVPSPGTPEESHKTHLRMVSGEVKGGPGVRQLLSAPRRGWPGGQLCVLGIQV